MKATFQYGHYSPRLKSLDGACFNEPQLVQSNQEDIPPSSNIPHDQTDFGA